MTCTGGGPCDVRLPNLVIESNDLICGTYQSTDFWQFTTCTCPHLQCLWISL